MTIVYTHANGYGNIDVHAEQFQLGRRLHDSHVMYARLEKGETTAPDAIKTLLHWYCELVNWVGQLRADYSTMLTIVNGQAEWEGPDGIRRRMVRMD